MTDFYKNIVIDLTYDLYKTNLGEILLKLDNSKDDLLSKKSIDEVVTLYSENHKKETRYLLVHFFTRFNSRKHTRKYLCESLIKSKNGNIAQDIIKENVVDFLETIKNGVLYTKYCIDFMNFLYVYMQNFREAQEYQSIVDHVFPLYLVLLQVFISRLEDFERNSFDPKNEDLYTLAHYTLQHELILLAKTNSEQLSKYSRDFLEVNHKILESGKIKFDLKSKSGLVFAYFLNNLPDDEKINIICKEFPIIDVVHAISEKQTVCISLKNYKLSNVFLEEKLQIVLYSAVLNTVDSNWLKNQNFDNKNFMVYIFKSLIQSGIRFTGFPEQIILISRTLCSIISKFDNVEIFDDIFEESLNFIWSHLEHFVESVCHNTRIFFKELISSISNFHNNGISIYKEKLFDSIRAMTSSSTTRLLALKLISEINQNLLLDDDGLQKYLLNVMKDNNLTVNAAEIYKKLMEYQVETDEDFLNIWILPILKISKFVSEEVGGVLQNIITHGFRLRPNIFANLFQPNHIGNNIENAAYLKCVQYARKKGIVFIPEDDPNYWRQLIPKNKINLFMIDQNEEVRILTLETIVETQKTTEEILEWELQFLIEYYINNVSTQIPSIRKKIGGFYKKILLRLSGVYQVILKKIQANDRNNEFLRLKTIYEDFLEKFSITLINYLGVDPNHPRRTLSLELLLSLVKIIPQAEWQKLWSNEDIYNLKNILYDSYESNKAMAVNLLGYLSSDSIGFTNEDDTMQYFQTCLDLVIDIKPSKSLSSAYMFQVCLLSKHTKQIQQLSDLSSYQDFRYDILLILSEYLEKSFLETKDNTLAAAQTNPLHGIFLSIKHLLVGRNLSVYNNLYINLFKKLTILSLKIKDNIMPIVCNPSPEGNLPEDCCEVDETSTAQMILVYAWRTMKEMMLLLALLIQQTIALEGEIQLLDVDEMQSIGQFFIDIFIQSKHRGVFEQAHVAFSTICHEFWRSNNVSIKTLPLSWLNLALALCTGKKLDDRLCSTRRSAGLPFLILSIISTEPMHSNFQKTVNELLEVAKMEDNSEFKMHSMNVLRFIFINAKVGDLVSEFIDDAVIAALQGFRSTVWGIRNSATLLFSALMTRMFGVQRSTDTENLSPKNRLTVATFYLRYPNLLRFLLKTLAEESKNHQSQIIHPVLLILARLYPSHNDKIRDQFQESSEYINICVGNPTIGTRYLAARASVSLISLDSKYFNEYFEKLKETGYEENYLHGVLLQIWYLITTTQQRNIEEEFTLNFLKYSSDCLLWMVNRCSQETLSLYFVILTKLLIRHHLPSDLIHVLEKIVKALIQPKKSQLTSKNYDWNRTLLLFQIILNKFEFNEITEKIVEAELFHCLNKSQNKNLFRNCMKFLIYINQNHSINTEEHPLIFCENIEISTEIQEFARNSTQEIQSKLVELSKKFLINPLSAQLNIDFNNIDKQFNCDKDNLVYLFLLLRYHPDVVSIIYENRESDIWEIFLEIDDEEVSSAVAICFSDFLLKSKNIICIDKFLNKLEEMASPIAADFSRLTAAQILVNLKPLYYNGDKGCIFNNEQFFNLMNIIMVLLEDEELLIRNTVSNILTVGTKNCRWKCIPNKAREEIMMKNWLDEETKIRFLIGWICRHRNLVSTDVSEIYERGEQNQYTENIPITIIATKLLFNLLHKNEPSQKVCTEITEKLIKSLSKPTPMMKQSTKNKIIEILKEILKYSTSNKEFNFQQAFNQILQTNNFNISIDTNNVGIKHILTTLYKPFF